MSTPELKSVDLASGVTVTRDDGTKVFYPVGLNIMPVYDADHWYVQAHAKKEPPASLGTQAYAKKLREMADAKRDEAIALHEQALEADAAWEEEHAKALAGPQTSGPLIPVPNAEDVATSGTSSETPPESEPEMEEDGKTPKKTRVKL